MTICEGDIIEVGRFPVRILRIHLYQLPGSGVSCLVQIPTGRYLPFMIFPHYRKVGHQPLTVMEIIEAAFAESEQQAALEAKNDEYDRRNWRNMPEQPTYRQIERTW